MTKQLTLEEIKLRDIDDYRKYKLYTSDRCSDWQDVRQACFERAGHKCSICGRHEDELSTSLVCHHNCYDHLGDELNHPEDVICICKTCHRIIHTSKYNLPRFRKSSVIFKN